MPVDVSSCYLNFITFFGSKTGATDVSFGGFRSEVEDNRQEASQASNSEPPGPETFRRADKRLVRPQASIHHQFDPENGTMLWIITAPVTPPARFAPEGERSKSKIWTEEFKGYMNKQHRAGNFLTPQSCFGMSLDIHLKLAAWSVGDFSYCMQDLDDNIRQLTDKYIQVQPKEVLESDVQQLYNLMEITAELHRCLSSNHKVLKSLANFYKTQFLDEIKELNNIGWKDECAAHIARFTHELDGYILEVDSIMNRAVALTSVAQRRESVTIFGTDIVKFQAELEPNQTYSWSLIAFLSWLITTGIFTTLTWTVSERWKNRQVRRLRDSGDSTEYGQPPDTGGDAQPAEPPQPPFPRGIRHIAKIPNGQNSSYQAAILPGPGGLSPNENSPRGSGSLRHPP
ncbi:hypothetical protein DL765_009931 [Monosporascus sp. GIB2]|nr:hypothetical protein DL765_009931 [Monosporascus sp. GIB2]